MRPYERLRAWDACHRLWIAVFRAAQTWPASERYGVAAQLKRAALSAGANIVEGVAKRGPRDCARHFNIAIGSLAEVDYLLRAAHDVQLLSTPDYGRLAELQDDAGKLTMALYRGLRRSMKG